LEGGLSLEREASPNLEYPQVKVGGRRGCSQEERERDAWQTRELTEKVEAES